MTRGHHRTHNRRRQAPLTRDNATHRAPDTTTGRTRLETLIGKLSAGVPTALAEVATPDRTLKTCATDIPAFFDQPGNSNGPTEALNDRLEHLRGTAPGFRNLTHYIARSLPETSGVQTPPTPCNVKSHQSHLTEATIDTPETRDQLFEYFIDKIYIRRDQVVIAPHHHDSASPIECEELEEARTSGDRAGELRTYARKREFDSSPSGGAQGARVELIPLLDHLLLATLPAAA